MIYCFILIGILFAGVVVLTFLLQEARSKLKFQLAKAEFLENAEAKLKETFSALSFESLQKSHQTFLELAGENFAKFHMQSKGELDKKEHSILKLVQPVQESLVKLDDGLKKLEKERRGEQEIIKEQMRAMNEAEKALRQETANLVSALRKPDVRGMWGEIQLKRVIEMAGMLNYCDFFEQQVFTGDEGRLRPDVVIRLPGSRNIVIDAKSPFEAFLEANQATDEKIRLEKLQTHARHLRTHIMQLSKKSYWSHFDQVPEFVILFLPAEIFFSSALQQDPSLIELGADQGVIIATPTSLIGLLRAVAYGWKQDQFSKNALEISQLGKELYKRVYDMTKHFSSMGKSLGNAVDSYNKAMGTLERRVLVSARRFKEFGAAADSIDLEPAEFLDHLPKTSALIPSETEEI